MKGKSGNPGGRKGQKRVTRLAREALKTEDGKGDKAIQRLVKIIVEGDDREAIAAAKVLMAYAHGQPRQSVDVTVDGYRSAADMSREELMAVLRRDGAGRVEH